MRKQLTVQLNGKNIRFTDTKPEKVNGRIMVPFRAIAEAFGAEVSYDSGAITAKKMDKRFRSHSAASSLLLWTTRPEKHSKPLKLTPHRTRKAAEPMFRYAFSLKRLA